MVNHSAVTPVLLLYKYNSHASKRAPCGHAGAVSRETRTFEEIQGNPDE